MSVQVSYKKQFALGFLLIIILIGVIEISVRVYETTLPECIWINSDVFENNQTSKKICQDLKKIQYQYLGNYLLLEPKQDDLTFTTSSHGFRGPEFEIEKEPGTYRIFIVGGSVVMGFGASSDEATIAGFLQKSYDESDLNGKIEVINAGVSGAVVFEETDMIKEYLLQFEPDLIIGYDGGNDARNRSFDELPYFKNNQLFGIFKMSDLTIYRTPFVLNDFLNDFLSRSYHQTADDNSEINVMVAENWKNRWLDICELGNENGFGTIVTIQPTLVTSSKHLSNDESKYVKGTSWENTTKNILETMGDFLPEMNKSCTQTADLTNVFDSYSEPLYFDDIHVTDKGNKIVAESLFEISYPILKNKIKHGISE